MHVGILIYNILKFFGVALMRYISPTSKKKEQKTKGVFSTQWKPHGSSPLLIIPSLEYKNDAIKDKM